MEWRIRLKVFVAVVDKGYIELAVDNHQLVVSSVVGHSLNFESAAVLLVVQEGRSWLLVYKVARKAPQVVVRDTMLDWVRNKLQL